MWPAEVYFTRAPFLRHCGDEQYAYGRVTIKRSSHGGGGGRIRLGNRVIILRVPASPPPHRRFAVVARAPRALRKTTDGITIRARYVRRHSCVTGKHTHNSARNQTHRKSLRAPPTATTTSTLNHETTRARVVSLERLNVVIIYPTPSPPPVRRLQRATRVASQHRFLGEMSRNVDDSRDIFRGFCNTVWISRRLFEGLSITTGA